MKLTATSYGDKYSIETDRDDLSTIELVRYMFTLAVALGHDKDNVTESMSQIVQEHEKAFD